MGYYNFTTHRDSLLLTDLSTDMGTGVKVESTNEMSESTEAAAVSYSFSILPDDVAGAEICDDTWGKEQ